MKRYRTGYKLAGYFMQGVFAGIICLCILGVYDVLGSRLDLSILGRAFEETETFCQTVEEIVFGKLNYARDRELFETDGELNRDKTIDIRQYVAGTMDEATQNRNTTYRLGDLLDFADRDAGWMEQQLAATLLKSGSSSTLRKELIAMSDQTETILPLSGSTLASYAGLSADPNTALQEYYNDLIETSMDLAFRYGSYTDAQEDSVDAPSNVLFYVENTDTKQRYTNLDVRSLVAAHDAVANNDSLEIIFEGERRYNIMVESAEPAYPAAAEWFISDQFIGSGEKVLIAVDTAYPAGDALHEEWRLYTQRRPRLIFLVVTGSVSALLCLILLLISLTAAGIHSDDGDLTLHRFDEVPTDLALGIWVILGICIWLAGTALIRRLFGWPRLLASAAVSALVCVEYWLFLYALLSILRRWRAGTLFYNTVIRTVVLGGRQVSEAAKSSRRLLALYIGFIILNTTFLVIGGAPGLVMALVLNASALLYLLRDVVGSQTVRRGLKAIQEGDLGYRIDTGFLTGQSREMGEAVNEMGEGLEEAVDSMLRNERLKSELITNVSHDLKTPLTSIVNYVDLLGKEELDNPKAREYVEILAAKTERLRTLTEDLIEVSRINSGNVQLQMEPLALKQFIMQAVGEFEDRLAESGLKTELSLPQGNVMISADGAQLWRVFENLLGNICKYAKSGTTVGIGLLTEGEDDRGKAVVTFENVCAQKIDVSAEDLQERFVRGDVSRGTEGSGLGLSIAGSLTQLMNGEFKLEIEDEMFRARLVFPTIGQGGQSIS